MDASDVNVYEGAVADPEASRMRRTLSRVLLQRLMLDVVAEFNTKFRDASLTSVATGDDIAGWPPTKRDVKFHFQAKYPSICCLSLADNTRVYTSISDTYPGH